MYNIMRTMRARQVACPSELRVFVYQKSPFQFGKWVRGNKTIFNHYSNKLACAKHIFKGISYIFAIKQTEQIYSKYCVFDFI